MGTSELCRNSSPRCEGFFRKGPKRNVGRLTQRWRITDRCGDRHLAYTRALYLMRALTRRDRSLPRSIARVSQGCRPYRCTQLGTEAIRNAQAASNALPTSSAHVNIAGAHPPSNCIRGLRSSFEPKISKSLTLRTRCYSPILIAWRYVLHPLAYTRTKSRQRNAWECLQNGM
jgi:hypothetical protein